MPLSSRTQTVNAFFSTSWKWSFQSQIPLLLNSDRLWKSGATDEKGTADLDILYKTSEEVTSCPDYGFLFQEPNVSLSKWVLFSSYFCIAK